MARIQRLAATILLYHIITHTHTVCRKLLTLPEVAGTARAAGSCRNCSRCRKVLELLVLSEAAGTARDQGSCWNFCSYVDRDRVWLPELLAIEEAAGTSARASIETASGCWNCSRLAAARAIEEAAFGCCSCLRNPGVDAGSSSRSGDANLMLK
ncbi:hypothetical protein WN943_019578 [Citrus x changshan-huyou]